MCAALTHAYKNQLIPSQRVRAYTQSDARIDPKVGGTYSVFGGNVSGVFTDLVRKYIVPSDHPHVNRRCRTIELRCSGGSAPGLKVWSLRCHLCSSHNMTSGHFSTVAIALVEKGGQTHLTLKQTNVPASDAARVQEGWQQLHFGRMKVILGLGTSLQPSF